MKPPKFRSGDIAYVWTREKVRILRSFGKLGEMKYEIEYVLSKTKAEVYENELSFNNSMEPIKSKLPYVPTVPNCPKCKSPWITTRIGRDLFYDCPKCKITAEEACDNTPPEFDMRRLLLIIRDDDIF